MKREISYRSKNMVKQRYPRPVCRIPVSGSATTIPIMASDRSTTSNTPWPVFHLSSPTQLIVTDISLLYMIIGGQLGIPCELWYVCRMWGIHLGFYRRIEHSENCRITIFFGPSGTIMCSAIRFSGAALQSRSLAPKLLFSSLDVSQRTKGGCR